MHGALGLVVMQVISRMNLEHIQKYTRVLLFSAFVMLVLVKVPGVGVASMARRAGSERGR